MDDSQLCGNPAQAIILKSDCNAEHTHQDPASDGLPPILYSMACRRNRCGTILELPCRISVAKRACRLLFPSCRQNGMWEMIGGWTLKTRLHRVCLDLRTIRKTYKGHSSLLRHASGQRGGVVRNRLEGKIPSATNNACRRFRFPSFSNYKVCFRSRWRHPCQCLGMSTENSSRAWDSASAILSRRRRPRPSGNLD